MPREPSWYVVADSTVPELQTTPEAFGSLGQQTPHPLVDWCWSLRVFLVRVSDPVFVRSQYMAERDLLFLGPMTMLIRSVENDRDTNHIESQALVQPSRSDSRGRISLKSRSTGRTRHCNVRSAGDARGHDDRRSDRLLARSHQGDPVGPGMGACVSSGELIDTRKDSSGVGTGELHGAVDDCICSPGVHDIDRD